MMFARNRSEGSQGTIIAEMRFTWPGVFGKEAVAEGAGWCVISSFLMSRCKAIKTRSHPMTLLKINGFCLHALKCIVCLMQKSGSYLLGRFTESLCSRP